MSIYYLLNSRCCDVVYSCERGLASAVTTIIQTIHQVAQAIFLRLRHLCLSRPTTMRLQPNAKTQDDKHKQADPRVALQPSADIAKEQEEAHFKQACAWLEEAERKEKVDCHQPCLALEKIFKECRLSEPHRFEIASKRIREISLFSRTFMPQLALTDDHRFQLARAEANRTYTRYLDVQDYQLSQEQRFYIAQMQAENVQQDIKRTFDIKQYDLNQKQRFEVAKIRANKITSACVEVIIKITDYALTQDQIVDLAKVLMVKASRLIQELNIKDTEGRDLHFEIAKHVASHSSGLSANIKLFQLHEKQRFEVAKIAAQYEDSHISQNIKEYELSNPDHRYEIACLAAVHHGQEVSMCIREYELPNPLQRFEVAKLAFKDKSAKGISRTGEADSTFIANYQLDDPDHRFIIAKIDIENFDFPGHFSKAFNYTTLEQYQLSLSHYFELAKILAKRDQCFSKQVQTLSFKEEDKRYALMKIAAEAFPYGVADYLENYDIENDDYRFDIVRQLIPQHIHSSLLDYLRIEAHRFEIAKIMALANGYGTAQYIEDYKLTEAHREEIACMIARQNGEHIAYQIDKFTLSEDSRFKTANYAVVSSPKAVCEHLDNFSLDPAQVLSIFMSAMERNTKVIKHAEKLFSDVTWRQYRGVRLLCSGCVDKEKASADTYGKLLDEAQKLKDKHAQETVVRWIGYHDFIVQFMKVPESTVSAHHDLLSEIIALRQPHLRYQLINLVFRQVYPDSPMKREAEVKASPAALLLSRNSLSKLFLVVLQPIILRSKEDLREPAKLFSAKVFKDGKRKEIALKSLIALVGTLNLTSAKKAEILRMIAANHCSARSATILLQKLQIIIELGKEERLQALKHIDELDPLLQTLFIEMTGIPPVANFGDKYLKVLDASREPSALLTYASKIRQVKNNQALLKVFQEFVLSLLEGGFRKWRLSCPGLHMETIYKLHPQLEKEWNEGAKESLESLLAASQSERKKEDAFNLTAYFRQKLSDGHLPENRMNLFSHFLYRPDFVQEEDFESALKNTPQENRQEIATIQLQRVLFALCRSTDHKQQVEMLNTLEPLARETNLDQFCLDIREALEWITTPPGRVPARLSEWTVADTDDWNDLFLIGTEVNGSCQRVNGIPEYNKCLMAFVRDVKNRAIVIKNQQGKIVARRILRLLWNGTTNIPVLFMERLYTTPGITGEMHGAIEAMAKKRAHELRLTLVTEHTSLSANPDPYSHDLESLGSPASFEYVDAIHKFTNGTFTIGKNKIKIIC